MEKQIFIAKIWNSLWHAAIACTRHKSAYLSSAHPQTKKEALSDVQFRNTKRAISEGTLSKGVEECKKTRLLTNINTHWIHHLNILRVRGPSTLS